MKKSMRTAAAVFFAASAIASAQGGSAIITLVMPPPGGDGFADGYQGAEPGAGWAFDQEAVFFGFSL